jgi:hypothetical protein
MQLFVGGIVKAKSFTGSLIIGLIVSGCATAQPATKRTLDPQIESFRRQGIEDVSAIAVNQGCTAKGYDDGFAMAQKLESISQQYVSVTRQFGTYSDAEIRMAKDKLLESSVAHISLLNNIAKKAEAMGCTSVERTSYNNIIASPVYGTGMARVFNQELMIAQSKLSQLPPR